MTTETDILNPVDKSPQTADSRMTKASLSAVFIFGILAIYVVLVGIMLTGMTYASFSLFAAMFTVSYLVLYAGMPAASLCWGVLMVYRLTTGKQGCRITWTGIKYGIVIFGVMGLVLWSAGAMLPGPRTRTIAAGYWLHAKAWVDVEEVRDWAAKYEPPSYLSTVPWGEAPPCLRNTSYFAGTISYRAGDRQVTCYEGSALGHWGVTIAQKGTPIPDEPNVLTMEDGVWVWYD